MVNLQILLAVLRAGRCSDRLLRFWEARNLRKGAAPIFGCLMLPSRFGSVMEPLLRRKRIPMDSNVGFLWQKYHQYFQ
ncbi:hypothetical protein Bca4012_043734 [Brassica carinata]